jgi:hypothetical protein
MLKISRWHRHGKWGSVGLLSKLDLIGPLSDSSYGSGVYDHVFLPSISLIGVNRDLITPARDTAFFDGDSVDYCPKSRCWSGWNVLRKGQGWKVISPIIVWTLRSLWYGLSVFGPTNPPPRGQYKVSGRNNFLKYSFSKSLKKVYITTRISQPWKAQRSGFQGKRLRQHNE